MNPAIEQIHSDSGILLQEGSSSEMTNLIYDTLMGNHDYPKFDATQVDEQECDATNNCITFVYLGHQYKISVTRIQ